MEIVNDWKIQQFLVGPADHQIRLDQFLKKQLPWRSRTELQQFIPDHVRVNELSNVRPSKRLASGDVVRVRRARVRDLQFNEQDFPAIPVLYEDEFYLIVDKPPHLAVHPTLKYQKRNLIHIVRQRCREQGISPTLIHRLDRETSGVLMLAKTGEIARVTQELFYTGTMTKEYLVIVRNQPVQDHFFVDVPLGPAKNSRVGIRQGWNPEVGAPAKTELFCLARFAGHAILLARLHSGRQHQIRAHLDHIGLEVVGDKIYGGDESIFLEFLEKGLTPELFARVGMDRQALHAFAVSFFHPYLQRELHIIAPLPQDMTEYLARHQFGGFH
jgi:23S rRNA pseudouridine1911/1915/1917 synthase